MMKIAQGRDISQAELNLHFGSLADIFAMGSDVLLHPQKRTSTCGFRTASAEVPISGDRNRDHRRLWIWDRLRNIFYGPRLTSVVQSVLLVMKSESVNLPRIKADRSTIF